MHAGIDAGCEARVRNSQLYNAEFGLETDRQTMSPYHKLSARVISEKDGKREARGLDKRQDASHFHFWQVAR